MSEITRGPLRFLSLPEARAFLILAVFSCFITGMANIPVEEVNKPTTQSQAIQPLIDKALSDMQYAYSLRSVPAMTGHLDSDFEGWLEFKSNLEQYFLNNKDLRLQFVTDSFLTDNGLISVSLHWFKRSVDMGGAFHKTEGSSQFVFRRYPDGLKLLYLRQDNPFF